MLRTIRVFIFVSTQVVFGTCRRTASRGLFFEVDCRCRRRPAQSEMAAKTGRTGRRALSSRPRAVCASPDRRRSRPSSCSRLCKPGDAMNIIIWLAIGGLVGWAASKLMHSPEGILMNVLVGVAGAFVGGWLLGPMI